jgi:hypothetical protein
MHLRGLKPCGVVEVSAGAAAGSCHLGGPITRLPGRGWFVEEKIKNERRTGAVSLAANRLQSKFPGSDTP